MRKLKFKLFGKPKKSCVSFSVFNFNTTEDRQKSDEFNTKPKLVLGIACLPRKVRCFEESEFRLDWVPDYVNVIQQHVDPETGKRYYRYVDTYGRNNPKEEIERLYAFGRFNTTQKEEKANEN